MDKVCILIRRAPYGTLQAAEGLRHLIGATAAGMPVSAMLVDDGVYLAKRGQAPGSTGWTDLAAALQQVLTPSGASAASRARVYVHEPSVVVRGLDPQALVPGVELLSDEGLAALLVDASGALIF